MEQCVLGTFRTCRSTCSRKEWCWKESVIDSWSITCPKNTSIFPRGFLKGKRGEEKKIYILTSVLPDQAWDTIQSPTLVWNPFFKGKHYFDSKVFFSDTILPLWLLTWILFFSFESLYSNTAVNYMIMLLLCKSCASFNTWDFYIREKMKAWWGTFSVRFYF